MPAASTVFDYLAAGETVTLSYSVLIDDQDGGQTPQSFDVVITGTADGIPAIELSEVQLNSDSRGFVINGVSFRDLSGLNVR